MSEKSRIWEIDFVRGIAVLIMIIFHLIVDLDDFGYSISYEDGFWYYFGKLGAVLFIVVSGISSTLSRNNKKRGIIVLFFAALLTIVTYFIDSEFYIRFGILHFLGIGMLLSVVIQKMKIQDQVFASIFVIAAGYGFSDITISNPYLFPIGLVNYDFSSLDYYPIFPWIGVFIAGIIIGLKYYTSRSSLFKREIKFKPIAFLGRHSLVIYLVHQPIMILLLYLILKLI